MAYIEIQYVSICGADKRVLPHDEYNTHRVTFKPQPLGNTEQLYLKIIFRINNKVTPTVNGRFSATFQDDMSDFRFINDENVIVQTFRIDDDPYVFLPIRVKNVHRLDECRFGNIFVTAQDEAVPGQDGSHKHVVFKGI